MVRKNESLKEKEGQTCVYIYNPTSGRQNNAKNCEYVKKQLEKKFASVQVRETRKRGDAGTFAKNACEYADVIVISGGDGTMNEVINAISRCQKRPKIGYIPTGTTNDLAHSLKIPKNLKKAMKIILDGQSVMHDVFRVNDRYGIYVCGFGIFTGTSYLSSQKDKKKFGRLGYVKYCISDVFTAKPIPVKLDFEGGSLSGDYALALAVNSRYVAGFKIDKMAKCNDGFVNVVLVKNGKKKKNVTIRALLRICRLFLFGEKNLKSNKHVSILKLQKFHVQLPQTTVINLDGEGAFKGSFDFEVLKEHVEIFVKK